MKKIVLGVICFFALAACQLKKPAQDNAKAVQKSEVKKYLYVGRSPKERSGFKTVKASIEVHDLLDNHKLVKVITLPASVMNIRGIMADANGNRLYVSHYGDLKTTHQGYLLCADLTTGKEIWHKKYEHAVDRGALTPNGKKIFMPAGEDIMEPYGFVIDTETGEEEKSQRFEVASRTHNTIVSLDGKLAFMSALGKAMDYYYLHVLDAKTNKNIKKIGPTSGAIRPFSINAKATLAFINVNKLIGFEVGDVKTGKILYTVSAPEPYKLPADIRNSVFSHGIALTSDEQEVWVVDQKNIGLHVFDVSGLPTKAPVWKKFIKTANGKEKSKDGSFVYGEDGVYGQPGWIMGTIDGKYIYTETGEIVDASTKKILGHLVGANGKWTNSRFALEVDFKDGKPVAAGDQFVVGRKK